MHGRKESPHDTNHVIGILCQCLTKIKPLLNTVAVFVQKIDITFIFVDSRRFFHVLD